MIWFLIIDFLQIFVFIIITSSIRFAGIIHQCIILCYIKATGHSIRHFNWQKIRLLFHPINWYIMLPMLLSAAK